MRETWIHPLGHGPVLLKKLVTAGWTSFLVDMEHNYLTEEEVMTAVHVIKGLGGRAVVRPPSPEAHAFKRLLETGADRFLFAGITRPEELALLHEAKLEHAAYAAGAADVEIIPMIESRAGLDRVDEIAAVATIAGVHIGPNDLARDLGLKPKDLDAMLRVLQPAWACIRGHGKRVGNFIHVEWFDRFPYDGIDIGSVAAQQLLDRSRSGLPPLQSTSLGDKQ
jgi:4-hydroxy-2-oxoheptanedioate aldolase